MDQTAEEQWSVSCSWTKTREANFNQNKWEAFIHAEAGFGMETRTRP